MTETTAIRPSSRTDRLGFSDIVRIRNRVLALAAEGKNVLRLEGGEPFPPTPEFIKDAIKTALDENRTRYAPSSGIPELLSAIRAKLGRRNGIVTDESNLLVVGGGAHGLFCAFQASLDPGDEAIFVSPYWTPIRDQVTFAGATPVMIPWSELAAGVEDAFEKRITPRTKVLYVNSPANPTGLVLGPEELEALARVAQRHDLIVVADEAYEDIIYDGAPHVAIASLAGMARRTITVFTLSKSWSLTGGRIGYVVAEPPLMPVLRKLVLNTTNGVSTPTQYGALAALRDGDAYLERVVDGYRQRRDYLLEGVRRAGFHCDPPRGAFYLFADVRGRLGHDSWAAMETLLARTGIASVPGAVFGGEGEGHLRLSFSNPMEVLEEAVEALGRL